MVTLVSIDCYKIMTNKMIVKITTLVSISTVWWTLGIKQQKSYMILSCYLKSHLLKSVHAMEAD